jgi:hypothetical protein
MKNVWRTAFVVVLINFVITLTLFSGFGIMLIPAALLVELILGIVWCFDGQKKKMGQGVLLGIGLYLLIGGSVCTAILMNLGGMH